MTRVLVTGGAGFISSNLCRHLLRTTDHEVVIMDALTYAGNTANIADLLGHERLASSRATSATPRTSRRSSRASTWSSTPPPSRTSRSRSWTAPPSS